MMDDMGDTYARNDAALRLRSMHLLYESSGNRRHGCGACQFQRGFGDVLGDAAKDVLGGKGGKA